MTDFGGYLKGFDYQNKDVIANSDFYKLVEKLFPQCGKGDILDLLEKYDPLNSQHINIVTFANTLNQKLNSCQIVLQSYVAQVVDEQICEPITPTKVQRANKRPECFEAVFLDLISGLLYRKMGSVSEWLDMYGR